MECGSLGQGPPAKCGSRVKDPCTRPGGGAALSWLSEIWPRERSPSTLGRAETAEHSGSVAPGPPHRASSPSVLASSSSLNQEGAGAGSGSDGCCRALGKPPAAQRPRLSSLGDPGEDGPRWDPESGHCSMATVGSVTVDSGSCICLTAQASTCPSLPCMHMSDLYFSPLNMSSREPVVPLII